MQVIGSDVSLRAIETATKNMTHADVQGLFDKGIVQAQRRNILNNPLVYSEHWPLSPAVNYKE